MTSTTTPSAPARTSGGGEDPPVSRGHLAWIVAGSLATGLVAALLLAAAPFVPAEESALTGAVLCGFALGWAILAVLSIRLTDQPQRWAAAPALFMGLAGLLLVFSSSVHEVLSWVWPAALLALVVGMVIGIHRQRRSRAGRWLLYPVIAVLAISAVGAGYETVSEAVDANAYPMPGQLVDVGGHRLHLNCTGSGSPTVVLEPGAGAMSSSLGWITPAVARDTRVCVYDRAGRGWSDPADAPQDGAQIATDLHTLLHTAGVPGPYLLAGHSFGGLYTLTFAARYPDEVAGLVLVDSTAPAPRPGPATASPEDASSYDVTGRASALASITARLGLARLYGLLAPDGLPPQSHDEVSAHGATAGNLRSVIDEYLEGGASAEHAASLRDFGAKPLIVLTAGSGSAPGWAEKQNALATLSTNSVHRTIDGATHLDLAEDEEKATATSQAIHDVMSSVRSATRLQE